MKIILRDQIAVRDRAELFKELTRLCGSVNDGNSFEFGRGFFVDFSDGVMTLNRFEGDTDASRELIHVPLDLVLCVVES